MAAEKEQRIFRRNRPGTKAKDFYSWPPQDFNDMDTILAGESLSPLPSSLVCFYRSVC